MNHQTSDSRRNEEVVRLGSLYVYRRDYGVYEGTPTIRIDTDTTKTSTTYHYNDVLDLILDYLTGFNIHHLLIVGLNEQEFSIWLIQKLRSVDLDFLTEVSTDTKIQPSKGLRAVVDVWDVVIDDINKPQSILPFIYINNVYYRFMVNNVKELLKIEDFIRYGVHRWKVLVYSNQEDEQIYNYCLRHGLRFMQKPHFNFEEVTY